MTLLAEELFLLSIDLKTKRPYGRAASLLSYTLNGALLAELMMKEYIAINDNKVVLLQDTIADPLLQETIDIIKSKPNQTSKQMIARLRRKHQNIQVKLAKKLEEKDELNLEVKELLGTPITSFYQLKRDDYPEQYYVQFKALIEKYKENQILDNKEALIVLLSFVYHSHLLAIVFPNKKEAKEAKQFIKQINKNLPISQSTKEIIESINVSILAAAGNFTL